MSHRWEPLALATFARILAWALAARIRANGLNLRLGLPSSFATTDCRLPAARRLPDREEDVRVNFDQAGCRSAVTASRRLSDVDGTVSGDDSTSFVQILAGKKFGHEVRDLQVVQI